MIPQRNPFAIAKDHMTEAEEILGRPVELQSTEDMLAAIAYALLAQARLMQWFGKA